MTEGSYELDITKVKKTVDKGVNFFRQKKVITAIFVILFVVLLIGSIWIRVQNLPLLVDQTTGENIPLALDPFYFLRVAETIVDQGGLPQFDELRQPHDYGYTKEVLPWAIVFLYKTASTFDSSITLQYIDVLSPVIFFAIGLIVFFFLTYTLTKSKVAALISSIFLAIIPPYLYRTLAGFADHEALGMFIFFLTLLAYILALKFLDKEKEKENLFLKVISLGIGVGFLTSLTVFSWGGIGTFLFMIVPFSFGLFWLIKAQNPEGENKSTKKFISYLLFYCTWIVSSVISNLIYGSTLKESIGRVVTGSTSILTAVILLFVIIDFIIILKRRKILKSEKLKKYRVLISFGATIVFGTIYTIVTGDGIFSVIVEIFDKLLHPFGTARVSLTVAENRQPYLNEWIGQIGRVFFWLFFGGLITLGINLASGLKKKKVLFGLLWVLFISGILFSRVSPGSVFNGTNFISQLFYFGSMFLFFGYFAWIYFKEDVTNIKPETIIIFAWALFMLIATRGAVRIFFLITPFVCFSFGLLISNLFKFTKKSKDEMLKMFLVIAIIIIVIISIFSFNNFLASTVGAAKGTGPSAHIQWQKAMDWVRGNTDKGDIFVHWWDYGHWVTYLGERPVLSDGGHFEGSYRDHLVGRYLLTTPQPETALSFMKTNGVSYLLIDPTDLGKYPAYSTIGGGKEDESDRVAQIPAIPVDRSQTRTGEDNSELRFYSGGAPVDEDIVYNENGSEIFLPRSSAFFAGALMEVRPDSGFSQPTAVYVYNNQQFNIPIRYAHFNGQLLDFGGGLDAVIKVIPSADPSGQQVNIDPFGAIIYLSPRTSKSLFAQLYLLNDAFENYGTVRLAHAEADPFVASINAQGAGIEEFVYFQGFRGPIKIWEVNYPSNILEREEFLRDSGEYAEFDDLIFVR